MERGAGIEDFDKPGFGWRWAVAMNHSLQVSVNAPVDTLSYGIRGTCFGTGRGYALTSGSNTVVVMSYKGMNILLGIGSIAKSRESRIN